MAEEQIVIPRYFNPYPYQADAWNRQMSGIYDYYIKIWARQLGKDTSDIQFLQKYTYQNPGLNNVYLGLNNKWIEENIFEKKIDGRSHWQDVPENKRNVRDSKKVVEYLTNDIAHNAENLSPGRIKFIGFKEEGQLIGNSYDAWVISEAGLYKKNAFDKMKPVWNRKYSDKINKGSKFFVTVNGTPRGIKNSYYDLLKEYTGCEDPADFPGEHRTAKGRVYVDKLRARDAYIPGPNGQLVRAISDELLEELRQDCIAQYGNDNLYRQEYECDFTVVNAGLVYQAIEDLAKDGRLTTFNLNTAKPVYMAWDIASKDKMTDASVCLIFQYINNRMMIYDMFEFRGKSLVDCLSEVAQQPYFKLIRFAALPWDSERTASSMTPLEEAQRMFPNINWHALQRESVQRGINLVRQELPNMVIHEVNCQRLFTAFNEYEYKYREALEDWSNQPIHNWASHSMDALRYAVMSLHEIDYYNLNDDGSMAKLPLYYGRGKDTKTVNYLRNKKRFSFSD